MKGEIPTLMWNVALPHVQVHTWMDGCTYAHYWPKLFMLNNMCISVSKEQVFCTPGWW